jgi:hypothetical protein
MGATDSIHCKEFPLVFKIKCLGDTLFSISLQGSVYDMPKFNGRGMGLSIEEGAPSLRFICDGEIGKSMALRKSDDRGLSLEVNSRRFVLGSQISLWSINEHPEWACRFCLNSDLTISPLNNKEVVLGILSSNRTQIYLVNRSDHDHKMIFEMSNQALEKYAQLAAENEKAAVVLRQIEIELAINTANKTMLTNFKRHGFVHIPNIVDKKRLTEALQEVNRLLGSSESGVDQFKAKTFPSSPLIVNSFNRTFLPDLMQLLLGGDHRITLGSCQIALRFPGDLCHPPGTCKASRDHFDNVAKHWHIDGCANNFLKGVTDHFGEINNFDCLIGILLADVDVPCSGDFLHYLRKKASFWVDFIKIQVEERVFLGLFAQIIFNYTLLKSFLNSFSLISYLI